MVNTGGSFYKGRAGRHGTVINYYPSRSDGLSDASPPSGLICIRPRAGSRVAFEQQREEGVCGSTLHMTQTFLWHECEAMMRTDDLGVGCLADANDRKRKE